MQKLKERDEHKHGVYEKEVRRARKEAFKASSGIVKLQEELRSAKNRATLMREEVEVQKRKLEVREKETFAAQYSQISLQEELEGLKQKVKLVEEERDLLKTSLKEEEVARIAAEGRIPLPPSSPDAEFAPPKKPRTRSRQVSNKENEDPLGMDVKDKQLERLRMELKEERDERRNATELVDFMKLECQLKICACRRMEARGETYIFIENLHEWTEEEFLGEDSSAKALAEEPVTTLQHTTPSEPEALVEPDQPTLTEEGEHAESSPLGERMNDAESYPETEDAPSEETVKEHVEFDAKSGTFRRISLIDQEEEAITLESKTPQFSPSQLDPETSLLAPPLNPVSLSESPSLLSLGDSRPSEEGPRQSDECMLIDDEEPATALGEESVKGPESSHQLASSLPSTPRAAQDAVDGCSRARGLPTPLDGLNAPIEFPPTPGADLTLTAPLNFSIPASIAHQSIRPVASPTESTDSSPTNPRTASSDASLAASPPPASPILSTADAFTEPIGQLPLRPITPSLHAHPSLPTYPLTEPRAAPLSSAFSPEPQLHSSTRLIETKFTTTVPLAGDGDSGRKFPYSPGASKTREEALESIQRWRQGRQRARSVAGFIGGTPRKIGGGDRRDITK